MAKIPNKVDPVYFKIDTRVINDTKVPIKTYEVSKAAGDAIGNIKGIDGSQQIKGLWRIYTTSLENRVKLLSHGMSLRGKRVELLDQNPFVATVKDPDTPAERILISGLSLNIDNQEVLEYLRSTPVELTSPVFYGRDRDDNGELTHFRNGTRFIYAKAPITPVLPRSAVIAGQKVSIFHRSQKEVCKCCGGLGHKPKDEICPAYDPDQYIYAFRGHERPLSNFYKCPEGCTILACGHEFGTIEQLYQYSKLVYHEKFDAANKILTSANGLHAKRIAENALPSTDLSQEWLQIRDSVMKDLLLLKFKNCPHAQQDLVQSTDYILVEATFDKYWAGGLPPNLIESTKTKYWPGENKLGKILMELRSDFEKSSEEITGKTNVRASANLEHLEKVEEANPEDIIFSQPSTPTSKDRSISRSQSRSRSRARMQSKSKQLSRKFQTFLESYVKGSNSDERGRKRNASSNVNSSQSKKSNADKT